MTETGSIWWQSADGTPTWVNTVRRTEWCSEEEDSDDVDMETDSNEGELCMRCTPKKMCNQTSLDQVRERDTGAGKLQKLRRFSCLPKDLICDQFEQRLEWLEEVEFEKQSFEDKVQVAGRESQSLRDTLEDADRHQGDFEGKFFVAETRRSRSWETAGGVQKQEMCVWTIKNEKKHGMIGRGRDQALPEARRTSKQQCKNAGV